MFAAYVINRLPLNPNNVKSPYEMIFGEKPTVKHLRVFGSICYVHVPKSRRSKLDAKAKKCIFVGYDVRKKGWKCLDPKTHSFVVSRDVVFDEISSYYGLQSVFPDDKMNSHKIATVELPTSSSSPVGYHPPSIV